MNVAKSKLISKRKNWDFIKSKISAVSPLDYEIIKSGAYKVFLYIGNTKFFCNLYPTTHRKVKGMYPSNDVDFIDFMDNYKDNIDNTPPDDPSITAVGKVQKVAIYPSEGNARTIISHDFTDPCTWYGESVRITDGVLSTHESGASANIEFWHPSNFNNWIDLEHGRITKEDEIASNYTILVKKNDVEVNSNDYTVNYEDGKIIFDSAVEESDVIKATFSYEDGSCFIVKPSNGKMLRIEHTEIQFTSDIEITAPIKFDVFVYNPYDLPHKVLYSSEKYKNAKDFMNIGNLGKGYIPAFGGATNGVQSDVLVFPFDYNASKDLKSSQGTELRICIEGSIPFNGEFGTVTLYVFEDDEF